MVAPAAGLAAGAGIAAAFPARPAQCDAVRTMSTTKASKDGVTLGVGKKFMQMYFAENAVNGKVDLHKNLDVNTTKHLLEGAGGKSKDVKTMFDVMDTDGNGSVEYDEIVAYFLANGIGTFQEKSSFFFHACDVDQSGDVSKDELKTILHHLLLLQKEANGRSVMDVNATLYAGIPEKYVMHFQANEMVVEIFSKASRGGEELTEKEFQQWAVRGGKLVNRLHDMFNA